MRRFLCLAIAVLVVCGCQSSDRKKLDITTTTGIDWDGTTTKPVVLLFHVAYWAANTDTFNLSTGADGTAAAVAHHTACTNRGSEPRCAPRSRNAVSYIGTDLPMGVTEIFSDGSGRYWKLEKDKRENLDCGLSARKLVPGP